MVVSIVTEKTFDKIQNLLMMKTLSNMGVEATYLNIIKAIYDKPATNIIFNDKHVL